MLDLLEVDHFFVLVSDRPSTVPWKLLDHLELSLPRCESPTLNVALAALSTTWCVPVSMHDSPEHLLMRIEFPLQFCAEAVLCRSPRSGSIFSVPGHLVPRSPRCVEPGSPSANAHPSAILIGASFLTQARLPRRSPRSPVLSMTIRPYLKRS